LCNTLGCCPVPKSKTEELCYGYLLSDEDRRYYVYAISHHTSPDDITSITLDQVLRGEVHPSPTRSQRYGLALVMASSFLQLLESPWLPSTAFRKTDVFFARSDEEEEDVVGTGKTGAFLLDQPLIRRQIHPRSSSPPQNGAANNERQEKRQHATVFPLADSLDQLGILLLELCFGRPLENVSYRRGFPVGSTDVERNAFDMAAARQWQCDVNAEAGMAYAEAVAWCLGGNRSTPDRWRQDMLKKVILPLEGCRDYLSGATGTQPGNSGGFVGPVGSRC